MYNSSTMRYVWLLGMGAIFAVFAAVAPIFAPYPCGGFTTCGNGKDGQVRFHDQLTACWDSALNEKYYCAWTDTMKCPVRVECSTMWNSLTELASWISMCLSFVLTKIFFGVQPLHPVKVEPV